MGNFRPLSDLDRKIKRAKRLPGPGEYDINPMKEKRNLKQLLKLVKSDSREANKKRFHAAAAASAVMDASADSETDSKLPLP